MERSESQIQKATNLAGNAYRSSHTSLTLFTTISPTDDRQKIYCGALLRAIVTSNEGDWDVQNIELKGAQNTFTKDFTGHEELMCLSSEIWNWIEYETTLNDHVATSSLAKGLRTLHDKGLGIEIPKTTNEIRCLFLVRIISPDDIWVSPRSAAICHTNPRKNIQPDQIQLKRMRTEPFALSRVTRRTHQGY